MLILLLISAAHGQVFQHFPVNVYGDGNPANGVEDSREQLFGGPQRPLGSVGQPISSGTIKCDGKIRGTAMVVDTSEYSMDLQGAVIITAAHVIYDLGSKKRFRRCMFNYLALAELSAYRARIDLKNVKMGSFNPARATNELGFGEGDWAFLHIPKPWKSFNPGELISLREFSSLKMEPFQQQGGELSLIAFDSTANAISVSKNCMVIESSVNDLGGGSWKGQLLDDCDSGGGASGGGLVARIAGKSYLIGIRSGSHWSEQVFPAVQYPAGPPDGAIWDRHTNTNFGRAIDAHLLRALTEYVRFLESEYASL